MTKGIDDAYRGTVPAGRYPTVALRVEVDPRQVDVNVHPTKQLVRFSDDREARVAMSGAINEGVEHVTVTNEKSTNRYSAELGLFIPSRSSIPA